MFGAIGEVFGGIFGTKKAVENIVDKDNGLLVQAGGFFNDLHYSDQEEARDDAAIRDWGIRQLEALQPFKVVQRIMVLSVVALWLFLAINMVIAIWLKDEFTMTQLFSLATSDYCLYPILGAFGLYIGGGVIPNKCK